MKIFIFLHGNFYFLKNRNFYLKKLYKKINFYKKKKTKIEFFFSLYKGFVLFCFFVFFKIFSFMFFLEVLVFFFLLRVVLSLGGGNIDNVLIVWGETLSQLKIWGGHC
jgi:hypothetical protein